MCSRCCIPSASLLVDFGRHVDVRPCCSSKAVILWLEDHKFGSHCARPFVRESLGMTLNHTLPLVCIDWPQGSAAEPCERVCGWVNGTETVKLFRPSKKVVNRDYTIYHFTMVPAVSRTNSLCMLAGLLFITSSVHNHHGQIFLAQPGAGRFILLFADDVVKPRLPACVGEVCGRVWSSWDVGPHHQVWDWFLARER